MLGEVLCFCHLKFLPGGTKTSTGFGLRGLHVRHVQPVLAKKTSKLGVQNQAQGPQSIPGKR